MRNFVCDKYMLLAEHGLRNHNANKTQVMTDLVLLGDIVRDWSAFFMAWAGSLKAQRFVIFPLACLTRSQPNIRSGTIST